MNESMYAKDETNQDIDWWFIYKLPEGVGGTTNVGFQYLYYGGGGQSASLKFSDNTLDKGGALTNTLDVVFNNNDPDQGYIIYNDERTDGGDNDDDKGHCKGVLVFNKVQDTAMILLHSTPRFPKKDCFDLPEDERVYGQTYLCITLADYNTANKIAAQMLAQQNPQILTDGSYLPTSIDSTECVYNLYHGIGIVDTKIPAILPFKSKAGKDFTLIAKSKIYGRDYWLDLVSNILQVDINVESWRRGPVSESTDTGITEIVDDVMDINCSYLGLATAYNWSYTKDHSKWAAATAVATATDETTGAWVSVGDMNRMISQEKRGGGSICFEEQNLWQDLNRMEAKIQEEAQKAAVSSTMASLS